VKLIMYRPGFSTTELLSQTHRRNGLQSIYGYVTLATAKS